MPMHYFLLLFIGFCYGYALMVFYGIVINATNIFSKKGIDEIYSATKLLSGYQTGSYPCTSLKGFSSQKFN